MSVDPDTLFDELSEEFAARCRARENPSVDSYVEKHPELAEQIRKIFPSIAMMENLSRRHHSEVKLAQHTAAASKLPFTNLGDFQIVREVGRGGMGIVLEAIQNSLDRNVAVKVLSKQAMLDEKHIRRFEREARTASKLHHTNIVPVFGVGQADGYHYIVMQLIDGVDLNSSAKAFRKNLANNPRVPTNSLLQFASQYCLKSESSDTDSQTSTGSANANETYTDLHSSPTHPDFTADHAPIKKRDASIIRKLDSEHYRGVAEIGAQTARALAYAHEKKILHRDIKPGNLLVDENANVWIADFGLAKALEQDDVTRTNDVVGTLRYMAPEQVFSDADERADIYSLGLTLYELLTLQPAFDDSSLKVLFRDGKQIKITPPSHFLNELPRDLETIILKCCAYSPDDRYKTAKQVADDLSAFLNDQPIEARSWSTAEKLARWCKANPTVAFLSATSVLLLALVATVSCIGYFTTSAAYRREQTERTLAIEQKQKAEETLNISIQALNRIYDTFVPESTAFQTHYTDDEDNAVAVYSQPVVSDDTARILQELLSFYNQFSSKYRDNIDLKKSFANANIKIGDIWKQLGELQKSESAYQEALLTVQYFAKKEQNVDSIIELTKLHNRIGDLLYLQGKIDNAVESYKKAKTILEKQNESEPNQVIAFQLARTHYLIGRAFIPKSTKMRGGDPMRNGVMSFTPKQWLKTQRPATNPSLDKAIELLNGLANESAPQKYLLALCYRDQPVEHENGLEEAERLLLELIGNGRQNPEYTFALSETYSRFAIRKTSRSESETYLRKAVEYSTDLALAHPNNPQYAFVNAVNQFKLAVEISRSKPRPVNKPGRRPPPHDSNEAVEIADRAIASLKKLVDKFPEHSEYDDLLDRLGKFHQRIKRRPPRDKHQPFFPWEKTSYDD